jgi:DNA-binding winged helix-turn-helix (wHTH) protein
MTNASTCYHFGPHRLDPVKRLLWLEGDIVPLNPKPLDVLILLVESAPRLVLKDDLMQALWPDTAVEENNLTQCVSALRRALGESRTDHNFILTVPGRGYQFVAEVRQIEKPDVSFSEADNEIRSTSPERRWILRYSPSR